MAVIDEGLMAPQVLLMYRAVRSAGLPVHLITAMLQIARSTLYSWYAGIIPTDKYSRKIHTLTAVANLAVAEGLLPAPPALLDERWAAAIDAYRTK